MVTLVALSAVADQDAGYMVADGMLATPVPVPQTWVPFTYQCTLVPSLTTVRRCHPTTAATVVSVEVEP